MVPPATDARTSGPIAPPSNRVSADCGLRCRETGFPGRRKKRQYVARTTDQRSQRRGGPSKTPLIRGFSHACRKSPQLPECVVGPGDVAQASIVNGLRVKQFQKGPQTAFSAGVKNWSDTRYPPGLSPL